MLKEIRPAIVLRRRADHHHRPRLPVRHDGHRRGRSSPTRRKEALIEQDGKVVGSALIGQEFTSDKYFHGRPSATVAPDPNDSSKTVPAPYNAANSGGSNLGPTNKALIERVQGDVEKLKQENPSAQVPTDLVTTSGSGLDPHISPAAALFQVPRVAQSPQHAGRSRAPARRRAGRGADSRFLGRSARERAGAQLGARSRGRALTPVTAAPGAGCCSPSVGRASSQCRLCCSRLVRDQPRPVFEPASPDRCGPSPWRSLDRGSCDRIATSLVRRILIPDGGPAARF